MLSLIKQVFIVLLHFSESLVTKCLFANDELCMIGPTLIDMNLVELKYYPFMISVTKCNGNLNVFSQKYVFQKKQKTNVKAFNMITNKK